MTQVTNAYEMFAYCSRLTSTPDMTNMTSLDKVERMYYSCWSLTTAQIGGLDFSSSNLNYNSMFKGTSALKTLTSTCADEAHLSALKSHLEDTHPSEVIIQGETSSDGVTIFTLADSSGSIEGTSEESWD